MRQLRSMVTAPGRRPSRRSGHWEPSPASRSPIRGVATPPRAWSSAARARWRPPPPSSPTAGRSPRSPWSTRAPGTRSPPSPSPAAAPPRRRRRPRTAASTRSVSTTLAPATPSRLLTSTCRTTRTGRRLRRTPPSTRAPARSRRSSWTIPDPGTRPLPTSSSATVTISDALGNGGGATAGAAVDNGVVSAINVTTPGSGYITGGGIEKFKDDLPGLCDPASVAGCPTGAGAKYIPLAVPENKKYNGIAADEYEIGLVQYRTSFSSDMPATLVRGYVQLETPSWLTAHPGVSQHFPLVNEKLNGTSTAVLIGGQ